MASHIVYPETFQTFGDLLKYLRRRKQMTQVELSIRVGYSDGQISRLEQNQRLPDLTAIKALFVPALQLEHEPDLIERLIDLAQSARQEDAPEPGAAPYMGLLFFDQSDADRFFGREALTDHLANRVKHISNRDRQRFLAVIGASGSGKSSLVRAGLAQNLECAGWKTTIFTPTAAPMKMLAEHYQAVHFLNDQNHLLIVDQFEETFTLCRDESEREAFIERLLSIAAEPSLKTTVVIALRADFYSHCAQYPLLREAVAGEQEYIGQMTIEALRCAIEEPAKRAGWELEPGLVDRFIRDISSDGSGVFEPGGLPLLSHALLATWERRRGRMLTHAGYRAAGGVRGAIAETAESVFTDQLDQSQQILARSIFLRLTELGEGTEDTRRRAGLNELLRQPEEADRLRDVLNQLANARLITLNQDSAEVAHEAIIREWQRLREWLDQDRESLHLHRHLTEAALAWQALSRDSGELYRGARLAQALERLSQPGRNGDLNTLEKESLVASQAYAESTAQEQEAQRQRELMAAQRLAETEQQRAAEHAAAAQRLRKRAISLAGLTVLLVLVAALAARSAVIANDNARMSTAHDLISSARAELQADSGQSITLALRSLQIEPLVPAYTVLHQALFASHLRGSVQAHSGDAISIAINPAGDRLATSGGTPGTLSIWEVKGSTIIPTPLFRVKNVIQDGGCKNSTSTNLAFSPDGRKLAVGYCNTFISLIDTRSGAILRKFMPEWEETTGQSFSPDGRWLAAFGQFGQVTLWDVNDGMELITFQAHDSEPQAMTCFDFSPDGQTLATGGKDGVIKFWHLDKKNDVLQAHLFAQVNQGNEDSIHAMRFSPNGQKFADATLGAIHILDLSQMNSNHLPGGSPEELTRIPFNNSNIQVNSIDFSPAGDRLVIAQLGSITSISTLQSTGNRIQVYDATSGHILSTLLPKEQLMAGVISPNGEHFYSAHAGGQIHSWDISYLGNPEELAIPVGGNENSFYLGPDGKQFLVVAPVNLDGGVYRFSRWRIDGNKIVNANQFTIDLVKRQGQVLVNQNLTHIIISDPQNLVHVFDANNGALLKKIQLGKPGPYVIHLILNPDASRLIMQSDYGPTEGLMEVWDLNASRLISHFLIQDTGYLTTFSPDGEGVITYGSNNGARIIHWWNQATGQEIKKIDAQNGAVYGVIFTPDKKYLLSWGEDQTVKIREIASGRLVRTLTPPAQINTVRISPDQRAIAVNLSTAQTIIYDFENGEEIVTLPGSSIDFYPDGKTIINSMPDDPTVYAFSLDHSDLIRLACKRLEQITPGGMEEPGKTLPICQ